MKKGIVKCKRGRVFVSDLGFTLIAGQRREITSTQFAKSVVLQKAFQNQQIEIEWGVPMKKPPAPPFVGQSRKRGKIAPQQPIKKPVTEESIKATIKQEVAQMKQDIVGEIAKMMATQQASSVDLSAIGGLIADAVQNNMPKMVEAAKGSNVSEIADDEPIYIPSDITNSGNIQGGAISVESTTSEDTSLDDATKALRAMKKRRRK